MEGKYGVISAHSWFHGDEDRRKTMVGESNKAS